MPIVIGELLIPLLAIAAAFVLLGLSKTSTAVHGSETSHSFLWYVNILHLTQLLLGEVSKATRSIISHFAAASLGQLATFFHGMQTLSAGVLSASGAFAGDVADAFERLEAEVGLTVGKATKAARGAVATAEADARSALHIANVARSDLSKAESKIDAKIKSLTHAVAVTLPQDIGLIRAGESVITKDVAALRERTIALEDGAIKTWDWIKAHPVGVAAGAFAAAIAAVIGAFNFGAIKCSALGNMFSKRGCGMWGALDDLLGLLTDIAIIKEICSILPTFDSFISDLAVPAVGALTVAGAGVCSGSIGPPPALAVPALYLPPNPGIVLELA